MLFNDCRISSARALISGVGSLVEGGYIKLRELNERGVKGPDEGESVPRVPGESMFPGLRWHPGHGYDIPRLWYRLTKKMPKLET